MQRPTFVRVVLLIGLAGCADVSVPITVVINGKIVDAFGTPVTDAVLLVNGKPTVAAAGTFSANEHVPYEVTVNRPMVKAVVVVQGLTRPDPTIQYPFSAAAFDRSATVSGQLNGGDYPEPIDTHTRVVVQEPLPGDAGASPTSSTGAYSITRRWPGTSTATASVYALQYRVNPSSGIPTEYVGFGTKPSLSLTHGMPVAGQDISLSPVTSAMLSGSVTVPAGMGLQSKALY